MYAFGNTIFRNDLRRSLPRENSTVPGYVKHVHAQDGCREHVQSYALYETWKGRRAVTFCSEPDCILNKIADDELAEIGCERKS
jgi:hypothetical protein